MELQHPNGDDPEPISNREAADEPPDPDRLLIELLMKLYHFLRSANLEVATGLSGRERELVVLLDASGPTSVKSLVNELRLSQSTMTALVDRLQARGLVLRHPNSADRRSVVLETIPLAGGVLLPATRRAY